MKFYKLVLALTLILLPLSAKAQYLAIKANALEYATTTLNVGLETYISKNYTFNVSAGYNPWNYPTDKLMKLWYVSPEIRRWGCDAFAKHFYGINAVYGEYNWSRFADYRMQGKAMGAGIFYGYAKNFNQHWGMEAPIGVGYIYTEYGKYRCEGCGTKISQHYKHMIAPTKLSLSFIYFLK